MAQICSICFKENPEGVLFCEACGIELTPPTPTPQVSTPTLPKPPHLEEPNLVPPTPPHLEEPNLVPPTPPHLEEPNHLTSTTTEEPVTVPSALPKTTIQTELPTRLISKSPGSTVPQFPLEGTSILIGRFDPDLGPVEVDLDGFLGDDTISRNHAELYLEGGSWKIKDLGSVNGVFIKKAGGLRFGPRITAPEVLEKGDEISIAKIRFLLD